MKKRNVLPPVKKALQQAIYEQTLSYASAASVKSKFLKFQDYLEEKGRSGNLDNITKEDVLDYSRTLEGYSTSYKHGLLSAVNVVLTHLTYGAWVPVTGVKDCGFERRKFVRTEKPLETYDTDINNLFHALINERHKRATIVAHACLLFGLRLKEAVLLDYQQSLKDFTDNKSIQVKFGTKGGRPRTIKVEPDQLVIDTLIRGAEIQADHYSIIPEDQTWIQFCRSEIYRYREHLKKIGIKSYKDLRAIYACRKYYLETDSAPPIYGGRATKNIDLSARKCVFRRT
ncbi:integrase-like protein [Marinobacter nauticus]|uniref:Integrase-like protein n=1 Tax=Marinobacter nauticus TaxID=2743 RepID=A0A368WYZ8_MARNT|nr:integrase domain-containing protein [Marinobacter nauticus]RCW60971.1 integrase-like protein [Marinobacter nauticus]